MTSFVVLITPCCNWVSSWKHECFTCFEWPFNVYQKYHAKHKFQLQMQLLNIVQRKQCKVKARWHLKGSFLSHPYDQGGIICLFSGDKVESVGESLLRFRQDQATHRNTWRLESGRVYCSRSIAERYSIPNPTSRGVSTEILSRFPFIVIICPPPPQVDSLYSFLFSKRFSSLVPSGSQGTRAHTLQESTWTSAKY